MAVRINNRVRFLQAKSTGFRINVAIICNYVYHFGNKHVVGAKVNDLFHFAFDADGRFGQNRRFYNGGRRRGQSHFFPLVVFGARPAAAPIGRVSQFFSRQVDHVFAGSFNDFVRMTGWTNRNVTHRRIAADSAGPCNSQQVIFFGSFAASHQYRRKRVNHGSWFPVYFCH